MKLDDVISALNRRRAQQGNVDVQALITTADGGQILVMALDKAPAVELARALERVFKTG